MPGCCYPRWLQAPDVSVQRVLASEGDGALLWLPFCDLRVRCVARPSLNQHWVSCNIEPVLSALGR
eukprot:280982-Rhodomonas_salina.2